MTDKTTLASAMTLAFAAIDTATKAASGQVGQQKYKYADLTSVIDAIKPALVANGLFFTQQPRPHDNGVEIETVLHHTGGEHLSLGSLFVPADRNNAQGFGSALTYARRYALVTAFGVPVEDDDGKAATDAPPKAKPASKPADKRITGPQLDQIKGLLPLQKTVSIVDIMRAYQDAAKKDGKEPPRDVDELTEKQADGLIKRLNQIIDEERIKAANPQRDDDLNDEIPV